MQANFTQATPNFDTGKGGACCLPCERSCVEEAHVFRGVAELQALLADPAFQARFVACCSVAAATQLQQSVNAHFRRLVLPMMRAQSRAQSGISEDSTRAECKLALQSIKSLAVPTKDGARNFSLTSERVEVVSALLSGSTLVALEQLQASLRAQQQAAQEVVASLAQELERLSSTPRFAQAMLAWGVCRNLAGDCGPERQGHHAGVVHYFEYHSDREKRKRFADENAEVPFPSVEGFIKYSLTHLELLCREDRELNSEIRGIAQISDTEGQQRRYLCTSKELIVGFKRLGWPMQLLTVMTATSSNSLGDLFSGIVQHELNNHRNEARFNRLGVSRNLDYFVSPNG